MEQISTLFHHTNSSAPPIPHSFEAAWSPSKRNALDTTTFHISKPAPRAWQRTPHSPVANESRFKKVWKRYDLRSLHGDDPRPHNSARSPGRAVKKMRINSPKPAPTELRAMRNARQSSSTRFVATKWDRRRSVHHRKKPNTSNMPAMDEAVSNETPLPEPVGEDSREPEEELALPNAAQSEGQSSLSEEPQAETNASTSIEETRAASPRIIGCYAYCRTTAFPKGLDLHSQPEYDSDDDDDLSDAETEDSEHSTSEGSEHSECDEIPFHAELEVEANPQEVPSQVDISPVVAHGVLCESTAEPIQSAITQDCPVAVLVVDSNACVSVPPQEITHSEVTDDTTTDSVQVEPTHDETQATASPEEIISAPVMEVSEDSEDRSSISPAACHVEHGDDPSQAENEVVLDMSSVDTEKDVLGSMENTTEAMGEIDLGEEENLQGESSQNGDLDEPVQEEQSLSSTLETPDPSPTAAEEQASPSPLKTLYPPISTPEEPASPKSLETPYPSISAPDEPKQMGNSPKMSSPEPIANASDSPRTPSPIDDATCTVTLSLTDWMHLEDDRAVLTSFLDRAAARKATKAPRTAADVADCHDLESVQSRRDSDCVRQALASPRRPLEDKDGNLFSPLKISAQDRDAGSPSVPQHKLLGNSEAEPVLVLPALSDLILTTSRPPSPRRVGRTRSGRITAVSAASNGIRTKISVRRNDGNDTLVLTRTEAQELATLTRNNTRKNKTGSVSTVDRLVQWRAEVAVNGKDEAILEPKDAKGTAKGIRWSEMLSTLDMTTGEHHTAPLLDNAKPMKVKDDLDPTTPVTSTSPSQTAKIRSARSQTSRIRRLRALGGANGTPAKGLLGSTLLPDEVAEEATDSSKKKAKADSAETPVPQAKTRKSRLATPKKLALTPSVTSVTALMGDGKENASTAAIGGKKSAGKKQVSLLPMPSEGGGGGSTLPVSRGVKKVAL